MNYNILKEIVHLLEDFEVEILRNNRYENDIEGFKNWIAEISIQRVDVVEPNWEGKENGRSPESVISTLLVHINRYAKRYSRSAIFGSDFSTQEDYFYLISLKAYGKMTKMDLIKKNVHEKPAGVQVINRLIAQGWVEQSDSEIDKRSKVLAITKNGLEVLDKQMYKIRKATELVAGDLGHREKMELIILLNRLNDFHQDLYHLNFESEYLLDAVSKHIK